MLDQQILDLLRVDIDPAGDNHVAFAVGEEEKALLVHMADIAQCHPAGGMHRVLRFLRIIVILGKPVILVEDEAILARRQLFAIRPANMQSAIDRFADCAGILQPLGRMHHGHADALRAGIIFIHNRPPPLDHLLFDLDRTRRCGMERALVRGQVILCAHIFGQFEHPHKMRGHPLAVRHFVFLNRLQSAFRIEALHHHDRAAQTLRG